jgi:hypothetical protein
VQTSENDLASALLDTASGILDSHANPTTGCPVEALWLRMYFLIYCERCG